MPRKGFYEYDPVIYPRRVFVVIGAKEMALRGFDGLDGALLNNDDSYNAVVFEKVSRKDTGDYGCLAYFVSKKAMTIDVLSHEASHIVDAIEDQTGVEHGGEASAYLMGWVVKSLDEARKNIGDFIELSDEK